MIRTPVQTIRLLTLPLALVTLTTLMGCQSGPSVQPQRLIQHQALIDFSGLKSMEMLEAVRMEASIPASWHMHGLEQKALYTHQQWKSPSTHTGVGVVYARLPLPVGTDMLIWLARQQFAKQQDQGKELGQWTDELGRRWFEAENNKYHARGYAMVDGCDAWIVYFGYKIQVPPDPAEISQAARCAETFVPVKSGEKPLARPAKPTTAPTAPTTKPATQPISNQ